MRKLLWACGVILFVLSGPAALALEIQFPDFSNVAGLTLNGNAAQVGNVLRLTPATFSQAGSAFSTDPISLASNASFSSAFRFRLTNPGGSNDGQQTGADGLVFVVQTVSNNVGGGGGGIGYSGIPHSVGVEFDTWNNGAIDQGSSNHVGIDVGGSVASIALTPIPGDMNDGQVRFAWVDYNGANSLLEVRLSETSTRPSAPVLSLTRDLATDLGTTSAFVGFTSGTGAAFANHDVLSWTFINQFAPIDGGGGSVPEPGSLLLAGVVLGLLRHATQRVRRQR
jgi:legume-like lectin family protein/PEP-CTERM motif-containing protein